eukprot:2376735-Pleurochrysis_carterae.AAC.1
MAAYGAGDIHVVVAAAGDVTAAGAPLLTSVERKAAARARDGRQTAWCTLDALAGGWLRRRRAGGG